MTDPREHSTDMPRASRRGLLLGGLSAAALLGIAPCAQAAPAPAAPVGPNEGIRRYTTSWGLTSDGSFRLLEPINRDAMAAFLMRAQKHLR